MTGAFINAIGVLLGALFGLAWRPPLSASVQNFFRRALGVATMFFGFRLGWMGVNGTWWPCLKQLFIALLAVTVGNWIGRLLRLQKLSNHVGWFAGRTISSTTMGSASKPGTGFVACTVLFCAAPMGLIGVVTDGLSGDYSLLAVKAMMDALAMIGFVRMFGWPAAISAFPVYAFLGGLTFVCRFYANPLLTEHGLVDSVNVAAGLVACAVAIVIFEVRKVELANYLPALAVAPLLTWLFR
jgi:uncharacterized protein